MKVKAIGWFCGAEMEPVVPPLPVLVEEAI